MTNKYRETLINEIIDRELNMFLAVKNRGGTSQCQELPESFRIMREMTHGVLPNSFLNSYKYDLKQAEKEGRNFMTEKYALMESLIPTISNSPQIKEIVQIESEWRKEVAAQFPRSVQPDGHESFCRYLGCELQTYSAATIIEYYDYMKSAQQELRNLVRERYELLMRKLGYASLQDCETKLTAR
ncbi:Protein of unknown function [Maridesulfovibrio ferrireducens]|uniref:DUF4125 domain-containing protein n=1 Tax=Maridesulfovibrio ferrireducens TaxID=246191 RepID=A0A1G9IXM6_9BACT|nr:DUF4125 family protein [Maridesulfovibrio ferrireducens]SDL29841.1 Protein of unknown function [Maridesulfovibrio ferrireducens]